MNIFNHQGWARIELTPTKSGEIKWEVEFTPADFFHYPPGAPEGLWVERIGLDGVKVRWQEQYYLNNGYKVYLNGQLVGHRRARASHCAIRSARRTRSASQPFWEDGAESPKKGELKFTIASLLPAEVALTSLAPANSAQSRGFWSDGNHHNRSPEFQRRTP